jgi:hypothetical protein
VSFTSWPLYFRGNSLGYPLDRRPGEPQSQSRRYGEKSGPCRESNPGCPASSLSLCRLVYTGSNNYAYISHYIFLYKFILSDQFSVLILFLGCYTVWMFNSSSPFTLTDWGTICPCSVVAFSMPHRWNRVSKLRFSKKRLNLQNKYLITVNNNNNNKQIRLKPLHWYFKYAYETNLCPRPPWSVQTETQQKYMIYTHIK